MAMTETKEPLALVVKGREPEKVVAWACGTCGYAKRTEQEARNCCPARCSTPGCGAVLERRCYALCPSCEKRIEEERARELAEERTALYAKAKKVPLSEYNGPLYWEDSIGGDWGEGYYSGIDALLRHCEWSAVDVEPPLWVWACAPNRLAIDARDLIDRECEEQEMHEDAAEGANGIEELQAFLDKWCEKNGPTSYVPNESIAVEHGPEDSAGRGGPAHGYRVPPLRGVRESPAVPRAVHPQTRVRGDSSGKEGGGAMSHYVLIASVAVMLAGCSGMRNEPDEAKECVTEKPDEGIYVALLRARAERAEHELEAARLEFRNLYVSEMAAHVTATQKFILASLQLRRRLEAAEARVRELETTSQPIPSTIVALPDSQLGSGGER